MYKKVLIGCLLLFVVGCTSSVDKPKEIVRKEINCSADGSNFVLVLENGQIVNYIDADDGDLGSEIVEILNSEHLVGIDDNDKALNIMSDALKDLGGYCKE